VAAGLRAFPASLHLLLQAVRDKHRATKKQLGAALRRVGRQGVQLAAAQERAAAAQEQVAALKQQLLHEKRSKAAHVKAQHHWQGAAQRGQQVSSLEDAQPVVAAHAKQPSGRGAFSEAVMSGVSQLHGHIPTGLGTALGVL